MNNKSKYIISFITFFSFIIFFSFNLYSSFGCSLFLFFGLKFFNEIGKKVEIRDIIILLAILQWIIGPLLAYKIYPDDDFYYMAVDIEVYMGFVVPTTLVFSIALYLPLWTQKHNFSYHHYNINNFVKKYKNVDVYFILIGFSLYLITNLVPSSLRFVFVLFGYIRYVGLFLLYVSNRKNKLFFVYLVIGALFLMSVKSSLFHDLIIWLFFFGLIVAFIVKPTTIKKLIYLFAFLFLIISIQTVKHSFREALSEGTGEGVSLFTDLVQEKVIDSDYVTSETNLSAMVVRINQGWIIARIMSWTPSREPFANGETIKEAIETALMPRFLFPDKVKAGGRTYFYRFTGKELSDNTSMGLGLVGEAYANYGVSGGAFFMFIIGLFYNFFLSRIFKIAKKHPAIIFFIPLLFLQVVKAETDFSVILNHLIKATVVVWFIFWSMNKFFKIKI